MKNQKDREKFILKNSKNNRWYQYERYKLYLNPAQREVEVRILNKSLGI